MADVDPLQRPNSGQNLSVLIPGLLANNTRSGAVVVAEHSADQVIDSWDEDPITATSVATLFRMDATAALRTYTLPPSATDAGRMIVVVKSDASVNDVEIEVDDAGTEDISGATDIALGSQWDVAVLIGRTDGWDRIV